MNSLKFSRWQEGDGALMEKRYVLVPATREMGQQEPLWSLRWPSWGPLPAYIDVCGSVRPTRQTRVLGSNALTRAPRPLLLSKRSLLPSTVAGGSSNPCRRRILFDPRLLAFTEAASSSIPGSPPSPTPPPPSTPTPLRCAPI